MAVTKSRNGVWILAHRRNPYTRNVKSEQVDAGDVYGGIRVKEILDAGVAQRKISVSEPDRAYFAAFQQIVAGGAHDRLEARQIKPGEIWRQKNYSCWWYRLADSNSGH